MQSTQKPSTASFASGPLISDHLQGALPSSAVLETQLGLSYRWKDVTAHLTTRGKGTDQTSLVLSEETPLFTMWQGETIKKETTLSQAAAKALVALSTEQMQPGRAVGESQALAQKTFRGGRTPECTAAKIYTVLTGSGIKLR